MSELSKKDRLLDFTAYYIIRNSNTPRLGKKFLKEYKSKSLLAFPKFLNREFGSSIDTINLDYSKEGFSKFSSITEGERLTVLRNIIDPWVKSEQSRTTSNNKVSVRTTTKRIESTYQEYTTLYAISPFIFISYYLIRINFIKLKARYDLLEDQRKWETFFAKHVYFNKYIWQKTKEAKRSELETNLFNSNDVSDFQMIGFLDEKGLYISESKTLNFTLTWLSQTHLKNYEYSIPEMDESTSLQLLKLNIFNYYEKNITSAKNKINYTSEELLLFEEFERIKRNEWKDIVSFLESRKFTSLEIDFLINTLYKGKYDDIDIRSMQVNSDVQIFHLWHLFHLFDYQKDYNDNKLKTIKDFKIVIDLQEVMNSTIEKPKQMRRYYLEIQNGFTSIDNTLIQISEEIEINGGKMKPAPSTQTFKTT